MARSVPGVQEGAGSKVEAPGPRVADPRLYALSLIAAEAGAGAVVEEVEDLAERVAEGQFYVACVGQFKRGKSTLLNAMIQTPVLPVGVLPVTAAVTVLRYGDRLGARVRLMEGGWKEIDRADLPDYVTEARNSGNEKGVIAVEVLIPSPLLATGMCLVDTPGIGSVIAANTATTRSFVPHIDAALVVIGADPPISGEEAALVKEVAGSVHEIVVVLNKADRLPDEDREEAARFAERVLSKRLHHHVGKIYQVSATERLEGRGPERDWAAMLTAVESLAVESGTSLVREARERGVRRLADRLFADLDERRMALVRPVEESRRRFDELRRCMEDAERSLNDLGPLLAGEQVRLYREFEGLRKEFLARSFPDALDDLRSAMRGIKKGWGPRRRWDAILLAQDICRRHVKPWLEEARPKGEELYRQMVGRFIEIANRLLERLSLSGERPMSGRLEEVRPESGFRARSRFYFTDLFSHTQQSPVAWLVTVLFPTTIERDVTRYLQELLEANSMRVLGDFDERVLESRRGMEHEIRTLLRDLLAFAGNALERAQALHEAGAGAVKSEMERIEGWIVRIQAIRSDVQGS
jgi:hypothetical protein